MEIDYNKEVHCEFYVFGLYARAYTVSLQISLEVKSSFENKNIYVVSSTESSLY